MVRRLIGRGLVAALLAVSGTSELHAQADTYEWSGSLGEGQTLEVRGISGNIRAVLASGLTASVIGEKDGRERDFDEVAIEVFEHRGGVIICAVYGSWKHGRDTCDEDFDDDHDWADRDRRRQSIRVSVDFEVEIPAGVEFIGAMVSGDVEVENVESEVTATTVSGDVYVSTTEVAWGSTVSGEIEISMGSSDWDDLSFSTVSGDITIYLPAGIDTEVEFESLSGDFDTDFDVEYDRMRRRFVGSHVQGVIGDGGRRNLSFNTVSGDVQVRRARGSRAR